MMRLISGVVLVCLTLSSLHGEPSTPSGKIDRLIGEALQARGLERNAEISDAVFLRRVYLNITGRVPTIEEAEAFHAETYPNKRERLIDELINSEGHVSAAYHFWADLLRLNGEPGGAVGDAYELWVKEAIRGNMPYDEMVYRLVTAEGKFWENGAVGYYFRDRGMPLDNMSNTVRIFLGTRLECAQCHNHPFDKWTQLDYFKMASFSYGMNTRNYNGPNRSMLAEHQKKAAEKAYLARAKELTGRDDFPFFKRTESLEKYLGMFPEKSDPAKVSEPEKEQPRKAAKRKRRARTPRYEELGLTREKFISVAEQCIATAAEVEKKGRASRELLNELYNPLQYLSVSEKERNAKLPHDYQYSDASPHDRVEPAAMFGEDIDLSTSESRIQSYGKWMTSPENPTFTRVIVNRLWKEVFGIGIFEPVDELTDHTHFSHPELLSYLEELMRELNYDLKRFQQILYNTRTYQSAAFQGEIPLGAPYDFSGPVLRRMSAEQIWDSLVALALPEADRYQPGLKSQLSRIERVRKIYESLEERPFEEYVAMVEELSPLFTGKREADDKLRARMLELREMGDEEGFRKLRQEFGNRRKELQRKISEVAYVHLNEKVEAGELLLAMGVLDMGTEMTIPMEGDGETRPIMTKLPKPDLGESGRGESRTGDRKARKAELRERMQDYSIYRKLIANMARASELESPARRGHFLRDFGQSDREVIENASEHASVPQALNLLNGSMIEALTNEYSVFGKRIHLAGDPEEKARMIFQAMLTREPTAEEMRIVAGEVEKSGEDAYEGLVWALLNTQQFLFIQ